MKSNVRDALISVAISLAAIMYGAALAVGFFLGIFFFPVLFSESNIMVVWGWIGMPLGLVFGTIAFFKGVFSARSFLRRRVLPIR
jgi:hypothetical protein